MRGWLLTELQWERVTNLLYNMAEFKAENTTFSIPEGGELFIDPAESNPENLFIRVGDTVRHINFRTLAEAANPDLSPQTQSAELLKLGQEEVARTLGFGSTKDLFASASKRNAADVHAAFGTGALSSLPNQLKPVSSLEEFQGLLTQAETAGGGDISVTPRADNPQSGVVTSDGTVIDPGVSLAEAQANAQADQSIGPAAQAGGIGGAVDTSGVGQSVTVKSGDTLGGIAQGLGISLQDLLQANPQFSEGGRNPDLIFPGDVVNVPGGGQQAGGQQGDIGKQLGDIKQQALAIQEQLKNMTPEQKINNTPTGQTVPKATGGQTASEFIKNLEALVNSQLPGSVAKEKADVDRAEDAISDFYEKVQTSSELLEAEFERLGIKEQISMRKEMDKRIKEQTKVLRELPEAIRRSLEDVGVTQAQLTRIVARDSSKHFEILRDVMEERNALQADIEEAIGFAERFVNTQMERQAANLAALQWELRREEGDLDEVQREFNRLSDLALTEQKEIMNIALEAANNGASQQIIDSILGATTIQDAISMAGTSLGPQEKVVADNFITPLDAKRIQDVYGFTPPLNFTEDQIRNYIADNPGATGAELQAGIDEAIGQLGGGQGAGESTQSTQQDVIDQGATKQIATTEETITFIMGNISNEQLKKLKEKADAAGVSSFFKTKTVDVKNYLKSIEPQIQEALDNGFTMEEILEFLTK
jgi:LysM repeat protein/alkylhydroperoxidase/carboxymuconolactone decarboxylase family protein YurZ